LGLGAGGTGSQAITASGTGNFNVTTGANTSLFQIRSPSGTIARFTAAATPVNFFVLNASNSGVNASITLQAGAGTENFRLVNNNTLGYVQVPGKFRANQVAIDGPVVWSGTTADGPLNNAFYTHLNFSGTPSDSGDPVLNTFNISVDSVVAA